MGNNIAILIPSCNNYHDMWSLLAQTYEKFWPDCSFKKYIITNSDIIVPDGFFRLNVGPDIDWSTNCKKALTMIDEDYILMHIDDLIFTNIVQNDKVMNYVNKFIKEKGNYIKLLKKSNKEDNQNDLRIMLASDSYRTSTVFSIWNKNVLQELLISGESPRQFEVDGTERSRKYDNRYNVSEDCFKFVNLVIKRKIEIIAFNKLKKIGIKYDGDRGKMLTKENIFYHAKTFIYKFILMLPNAIQNPLIQLARKIG